MRVVPLFLALAACGTDATPASGLGRHEQALGGDPAVGTVWLIREIHGCASESLAQLGPPEQQARIVEAVLRYQLHILDELETRGVRDLFADGMGAAYIAELGPQSATFAEARRAFAARPRRIEELTSDQSALLFQIGAPFVYAARHDDVTLHETEDDATFALYWQSNTVGHPELTARQADLGAQRERAIAEHVVAFLHAHPGADVALILGRDHTMSDDFRAAGAPRVSAIWWDRAALPIADSPPLPPP